MKETILPKFNATMAAEGFTIEKADAAKQGPYYHDELIKILIYTRTMTQ